MTVEHIAKIKNNDRKRNREKRVLFFSKTSEHFRNFELLKTRWQSVIDNNTGLHHRLKNKNLFHKLVYALRFK